MDDNLKGLLAQKKAQLKAKQKRAEIQQYKDRLTKNIEDFSQKYRYADEAEEVKLGKFISKLDFAQPGQLSIQEVCPYPHSSGLQDRSHRPLKWYRSWMISEARTWRRI